MDALFSVILVAHILVGLGICGLVLMQHGKGADMGACTKNGANKTQAGNGISSKINNCPT